MNLGNEIKILAVDSSSLTGSVALCCGTSLVAESLLNIRSTHSEKLLNQIDLLLTEVGWKLEDLDLLAAVTGPGSFTGLRIGIATVKGLAQALNKPVVSISSLQTSALNIPLSNVPVCAFLDARKNEVYSQLFRCQEDIPIPLGSAQVLPPDVLLGQLKGEIIFVGHGVPLYRDLIRTVLAERALFPAPTAHQLRASQAAWLAFNHWSRGELQNAPDMLPIYIRPSDAELNCAKNKVREGWVNC